jgi:hypothetical protein
MSESDTAPSPSDAAEIQSAEQLTDEDGSPESAVPLFEPEATTDDSLANTEAGLLANGKNLEKDGAEKEHNRHQSFRDNVNRAVIWLFWTIVVCLLVGIVVFSYHMLTPASYQFLSADQLSKLQTVLVSALFSSALSGYAGKRMN